MAASGAQRAAGASAAWPRQSAAPNVVRGFRALRARAGSHHHSAALVGFRAGEPSLPDHRGRRVFAGHRPWPQVPAVRELRRTRILDRQLTRTLHRVYTVPEGNAYACVEKYGPGQAIRLGAFNDVEVRVSDVLR